MINNDTVIGEASRCRDLLAYAADLGGRAEVAQLLGGITFTAAADDDVIGAAEETAEGLVVVHNIKEIFAVTRLNLGFYEHSQVEEHGLYGYRMTWTREGSR